MVANFLTRSISRAGARSRTAANCSFQRLACRRPQKACGQNLSRSQVTQRQLEWLVSITPSCVPSHAARIRSWPSPQQRSLVPVNRSMYPKLRHPSHSSAQRAPPEEVARPTSPSAHDGTAPSGGAAGGDAGLLRASDGGRNGHPAHRFTSS